MALPGIHEIIADKAYDANHIVEYCAKGAIKVVIPSKKNRRQPRELDTRAYKKRNGVERCFDRLKRFRRIATRYDQYAHTFLSAITIATIVTYWLPK